MTRFIVVDEQRCLACKQCVVECALAHGQADTLAEAIAAGEQLRSRVYVEAVEGGGVPLQCRNCPDPACVAVCPKDALSRSGPDEPVVLDLELCIGCGFCMYACPFGVIDMSPDGKKAVKCDLCENRTASGELPACVVACPTGAIQFEEMDDAVRRQRDEGVTGCMGCLAAIEAGGARDESGKARCDVCGDAFAPAKLLDRIRPKLPEPAPLANICPRCRRSLAAGQLAPQAKSSAVAESGD